MAAAVAALHGQSIGACVGGLAGAGGLASAFQRLGGTGGGGSGPRGVHEKKEMYSRSGVLPRAAVKVLWNEASGPTVHVREVAGRQDGCRGTADASRLCFVARGKLWRSGKH